MKKLLDSYLKSNGTNRNQVVKATSINTNTIQRAVNPWPDGREREADDINPRVLFAVAEVLKTTPGRVLDGLIEMEMANDMTTNETKLLLIRTLDETDATALVTVDDMGDGLEAVIAEIDVPDNDTVRFSVNIDPEVSFTRRELLSELSGAMADYNHEGDGEFYPTRIEDNVRPLVDAEYMGISSTGAKYLETLSNKIAKLAKK